MTYVLHLGSLLNDMPPAFQNLYKSIGRVAEYKFHSVNRFLQTEPYSAILYEKNNGLDWYLSFATEEDYYAFIFKWS